MPAARNRAGRTATAPPHPAAPDPALSGPATPRRGRPPATSARELEVIALDLFAKHGFEKTTIDDITDAAGVSKRTFFRYFDTKTDVLWSDFDNEVQTIRATLNRAPTGISLMAAIRHAVIAANTYGAEDVPELRARMNLINSVPELHASAALHYDAWERAISDYAAQRTGQPADTLLPLAIGRTTLAACRAAYDRWAARADTNLTHYLDQALQALEAGFNHPDAFAEKPAKPTRRKAPRGTQTP